MVLLVGASLAACQPRIEPLSRTEDVAGVADGGQQSAEARSGPDARAPRTRARSHVLLGVDFSRPLKLAECARFYNRFDRPDKTCVYLRSLDHKPFKIEFARGTAPEFVEWDNAFVSTDGRGRPDMLRFDIDPAPAHRSEAVDAMLRTFGPPTSVDNAAGRSKIGTWNHDDYLIRYFFAPGGGGIVQMETKRFHDAADMSAGVAVRDAK